MLGGILGRNAEGQIFLPNKKSRRMEKFPLGGGGLRPYTVMSKRGRWKENARGSGNVRSRCCEVYPVSGDHEEAAWLLGLAGGESFWTGKASAHHVTLAQPQSKACASSQGQVKGVQHQKILIRRFSPAFVDRKADVFIVSRTSWQTASILHVLSLRQAEVRQRPAPSQGQDEEAVILDKGARSRVEKILYQEYLQEPETQTLSPEVWQRAPRLSADSERRLR